MLFSKSLNNLFPQERFDSANQPGFCHGADFQVGYPAIFGNKEGFWHAAGAVITGNLGTQIRTVGIGDVKFL